MSEQFDKYHLYAGVIKRLLLFTGLLPTRKPSTLYRLVTFVHGSALFLVCCAILNFCYQHIAHLHLFLKGLSWALSFLTSLQKMSCFLLYRGHLVELHAELAMTFELDLYDVELRPILLSSLQSFYLPSLSLSTMTGVVVGLQLITPILLIIIQVAHGADVLKLIQPFPSSYPWQPSANTWLYLSHYTFEIYAGVSLYIFTSLIDGLFGYYIFQITGQLRTLAHRIRNFNCSDNYRKVISECIKRHYILTKCQKHLEQIYVPMVLWMLVANALVMCALMYQATQVPPSKMALIVGYVIMKSMQTLVYGWFGTSLEIENDMFRESIYASDWPGSGEKRLMTDVLIMMSYKPLVLKACSLSNISIDMFVAVSNTAISYFFLLRTLEDKDNDS
ncbi:odorant receptor 4-like [Venturia canescens]|uniref:odorant receptor 4-like n=1 Tax=Venturia canescens TaxID=32260 RepID=UPI001C9C7443|nr:odorant receptor 4-like [Venturia canescens]